MRAMIRSLHGNCAFASFWYTHWHSLTDHLSTRENIALNNVQTYRESLSIRIARSLTSQMWFYQQRILMQYLFSLWLISSQKVSLFSSIAFLLTHYPTYNLIMEWSYEYVIRWANRNLNIDDIIAARLRGKFWSVRWRETLSPLFTWCHLRRRCASGILLYSWSLSID
jgi:hypothetical protein